MNRGRDGYDLRIPGEEYIPANYAARSLPVGLRRVYSRLFGTTPDRLFLNYRMRQLMQMLHATPLAEFVSSTNEDITYLPFRNELDTTLFRQVITVNNAAPAYPVYLHGAHTADEATGQTSYSWNVQLITADTVRVTTLVPETRYADVPVTFSNGLSSTIPLIQNKLSTSFGTAPQWFEYQVQSVVRPATDLTAILTSATIAATGLDELHIFDTTIAAEQQMYHDIWRKHPQFVMRYSALLLAIANFVETREAIR